MSRGNQTKGLDKKYIAQILVSLLGIGLALFPLLIFPEIFSPTATDTPTPIFAPTDTSTPTTTFTPSLTPTDTPTATFTPSSTPTGTPTDTPTATSTPSSVLPGTPTATFTPPYYPPPVLTGVQIIGCNVTFQWEWAGTLAEDEWFALRVGIERPHSIVWLKEREFTYSLGDAGGYTWEVAILRGNPAMGSYKELAVSERVIFSFAGCPTTPPTPTRTPTTTFTPTPYHPPATFTPTPYPPPELIGAHILDCNVTLRWTWPGVLAEDEWFDVRLGIGIPHSVTWVKEYEFMHSLKDGGEYSWKIAICKGRPEQGRCSKEGGEELATSERRTFYFTGCPLP